MLSLLSRAQGCAARQEKCVIFLLRTSDGSIHSFQVIFFSVQNKTELVVRELEISPEDHPHTCLKREFLN